MIREATMLDVPDIVWLGKEMHAESIYARRVWDAQKVQRLASRYITNPDCFLWVACKNNRPHGFISGYVTDYHFGNESLAALLDFYFRPMNRGSADVVRLIRRFEEWALFKQCVEVNLGISTGVRLDKFDRLCHKLGYQKVGSIYKRHLPAATGVGTDRTTSSLIGQETQEPAEQIA